MQASELTEERAKLARGRTTNEKHTGIGSNIHRFRGSTRGQLHDNVVVRLDRKFLSRPLENNAGAPAPETECDTKKLTQQTDQHITV